MDFNNKNISKLQRLFSNCANQLSVFAKYNSNLQECIDSNLSVITHDPNNKKIHDIFSPFAHIKQIKTIFKTPQFFYINQEIAQKMSQGLDATFGIDYSISFDVNTATYVHNFFTLGEQSVRKDFVDTLYLMLDKNLNIDPLLFMLENISKGLDNNHFLENLISVERLITCDMDHYYKTREIKSKYSYEKLKERVFENLQITKTLYAPIIEHAKAMHIMFQNILLAIYIARKQNPKSIKKQYEYILEFMDKKLHAMFLRELYVALEYFDTKNTKFFNPFNDDDFDRVLVKIENMAWDFTLIRTLETTFSFKHDENIDFFIPFVFSYDEGFLKLFELFYCKSMLIFGDKTTIPIPEYSLEGKLKKYKLDHYFTEDATNRRLALEKPNFKAIFEELKNGF